MSKWNLSIKRSSFIHDKLFDHLVVEDRWSTSLFAYILHFAEATTLVDGFLLLFLFFGELPS